MKRFASAAAILDPDGRILLVKHGYGEFNWELPGGAGHRHESVVQTAEREVREETGLTVKATRLAGVYYDRPNDCHHFVLLCTVEPGQVLQPAPPEITDCAFVSIEQLPRPISDFTVRRIHDAIACGSDILPLEIGERHYLR